MYFLTVSVMPNRLFKLIKGKSEGEKMLKVRRKRKRKERKRKGTQTRLPGFACLKLHHAGKEKNTRYVRSLNIMSRSITRPTVLKRNTSHAFSNANKGKKNYVNSANIFKVLQKKN